MSSVEEPRWWGKVRELHASGLTRYRIAKTLNISINSVCYAIDPEYRARRKAYARRYYVEKKPDPSFTDHKRAHKRRKVRELWRSTGKIGLLQDAYRRAGCA